MKSNSPAKTPSISRISLRTMSMGLLGRSPKDSDATPVLTAMQVFDKTAIPYQESDDFMDYGKEHIDVLASHFFPGDEVSQVWPWKLPQTVRDGKLSRTEWVMQQRFSYQGHFPLMISVVGALLFIPVSNAPPKRGASKVKLIKNCLRSLLKGDMLNSLMHISLNGPSVTSEEGQQVIKESVVPGWLLKIARNFHLFPLPLVLPTTKVSRTQYLHTGYSSSGWRARRATACG